MDSNHRFPVIFKHKDGARRRRVSSSQPVTGCTGRKGDANSAPPLESIPPLKLLRMSGFDRQRTGVAALPPMTSGLASRWAESRAPGTPSSARRIPLRRHGRPKRQARRHTGQPRSTYIASSHPPFCACRLALRLFDAPNSLTNNVLQQELTGTKIDHFPVNVR